MSWLWWLAAPIVSTLAGAGVLGWRDRRAMARPPRDPVLAHRAFLDALERAASERAGSEWDASEWEQNADRPGV